MNGPFKNRRRPTLPQSCPCSTIGAERLNFRVRNGYGCFPLAIATEKSINFDNESGKETTAIFKRY